MKEEFKEKLKAYKEGYLPEEERREEDVCKGFALINKRQLRMLRISKWKARFQNAFTAIGILIVFTIAASVFTRMFYGKGQASRAQLYENVVRSVIAVTEPNIKLGTSRITTGPFFTSTFKETAEKNIGSESVKVGALEVEFLGPKIKCVERNFQTKGSCSPLFSYPNSLNGNKENEGWRRLDKLPEATVAEAYISFDKFYETDEILEKFKDRELNLAWFAVDTGFGEKDISIKEGGIYPVGFPFQASTNIDIKGSSKLLNESFIHTLKLLKKYESIANKVSQIPSLDITRRIDYINSHGVKIYGVVVTGPSKEILKLKEECWIKEIQIGEVALWNWQH